MTDSNASSKLKTEAELLMKAGVRVFVLHRTDFKEYEMVDPDSGEVLVVNPFDGILDLVEATPKQKQANAVVLRIIQVRFVK